MDGLHRYAEAENYYQTAIKSDPNFGVLYGFYGTHLVAEGKGQEAELIYKKGINLGNLSVREAGKAELGLQ